LGKVWEKRRRNSERKWKFLIRAEVRGNGKGIEREKDRDQTISVWNS
jgi:hypothetical protein